MLDDRSAPPAALPTRPKWLAATGSALSHGVIVGVAAAVLTEPPDLPFVRPCAEFVMTGLTFRWPPPPPPPPPLLALGHRSTRFVAFHGTPVVADAIEPQAEDLQADNLRTEPSESGIPEIRGVCGCVEGGVVPSVGPAPFVELPIEPPPVMRALPSRALRAGMGAPMPIKLVDVQPAYPPIARSARIQGVVVLDATIDETGRVVDVRVLRSIAGLDSAAIDAVRRWRYAPAIVNGRAVAVVMTVTASFVL